MSDAQSGSVFQGQYRGQPAVCERLADGSIVIRSRPAGVLMERLMPGEKRGQRGGRAKARGQGR